MDQSGVWGCYAAKHGSHSSLAWTQGQQEDSLDSQVLHGGLLKGFKRSLVSWRTRERFQERMPLFPWICLCGLSRWVRFFLLTLMGKFPNCKQWLVYSHQWCPAVTSCLEKRYRRKSAMAFKKVVPRSPPDYWGTTCKTYGPLCLIDWSG